MGDCCENSAIDNFLVTWYNINKVDEEMFKNLMISYD